MKDSVDRVPALVFRQSYQSPLLLGLALIAISIVIFLSGLATGNGAIAYFIFQMLGVINIIAGILRLIRPKTLRILETPPMMTLSAGSKTHSIILDQLDKSRWIYKHDQSGSITFGAIFGLFKSGLSIKCEDAVISLRGFPLGDVLSALKSRGVEVPLASITQVTGGTNETWLLFSDSGTIGSNVGADVIISESVIGRLSLNWSIINSKKVVLTNISPGVASKGSKLVVQGESIELKYSDEIRLGKEKFIFYRLSGMSVIA